MIELADKTIGNTDEAGKTEVRAGPYSHSGTFFDHRIDLREPEGAALMARIQPLIESVEHRKRALKPQDQRNREKLLRKVSANALRCFFHRNPARVAYFRRHGPYDDGPSWLNGKALSNLVDLLCDAGLMVVQTGFGVPSPKKGRASSFELTDAFQVLAFECGISAHSLVFEQANESLVKLRTGKENGRERVRYSPTSQTEHWSSQLAAINSLLASQDISVSPSSDERRHWLAKLNDPEKRKGMPYVRPEQIRTSLFRSFTTRSKDIVAFAEGGRLYGPWWTNAPKGIRKAIQINGKPTVELDYSSLHLRMLYNEKGFEAEDDLYRLELLTALAQKHGLNEDAYRPWVKRHTQALINCSPNGRPWTCKLEVDEIGPPELERKELVSLIAAKHHLIADSFMSGAGLRLQKIDSDIALEVVFSLMQEGIVVLPVHDSFLVQSDHEARLYAAMHNAYCERFGFQPVITKKAG